MSDDNEAPPVSQATLVEPPENLTETIDEVVTDVADPSASVPHESPPQPSGETSGAGGASSPASGSPVGENSPTPKRGRGRPRKNAESPELQGIPKKEKTASFTDIPQIDQETAAIEPCAQICTMLVNMSGMALGGEAAAMKVEEQKLAKEGFAQYFKAKGVNNVPPSFILIGALCPYYIRIITQTPAKTTISTIFGRAWFGVKEFFKRRKNARSNRRSNNVGENNPSNETSATSES